MLESVVLLLFLLLFKENISVFDGVFIRDTEWLEYSFMYITDHSGHIGNI